MIFRTCIDSRETALLAIEKINDVNAELRRHIDPFTGLANHFQSSDADKIEKFLNLMQGGVGTIFYDSKLFLIRARDAGTLHWAALVADTDDTRGASNWVLGKLDRFFFIISIKTYLMMCSLSHKYKLQMQPKLNLF